jgi:UDP-3-O-[3-hydroxymyristoyl] glucosamine N-acyltransferase
MKISEIVRAVDGELERGSPDAEMTGVAGLYDCGPADIAFISSSRYLKALGTARPGCLLASPGFELDASGLPQETAHPLGAGH